MPDLKQRLEKDGKEFDFFQAMSLIEQHFAKIEDQTCPFDNSRVRFIPDNSIRFPSGDIKGVQTEKDDSLRFILSFMSLCGMTSPLPSYFLEHCSPYQQTQAVLQDFLTIFNHRLYVLFYHAWRKNRFMYHCSSRDFLKLCQYVGSIAGLTAHSLSEKERLVAYAGMFSAPCRSADNLEAIISDFFGGISVSVNQWIPQWTRQTDLKQLGLSMKLGYNAMLGTHYLDTSGKFRIILGPLERELFESFQPGKPSIELLKEIVREYLADPLVFDIEVRLKASELTPVVLGEKKSQLGITASCGSITQLNNPYTLIIEAVS